MKKIKCLDKVMLTSASTFEQVRVRILHTQDEPNFSRFFVCSRNFIEGIYQDEESARAKFTEICNKFIERGYRK